MLRLILICLVGSIFSYQHSDAAYNFKIVIPDSWKYKKSVPQDRKKLEQVFSAHSKDTYYSFNNKYYQQTLSISVQSHRASMYYEDLEDKEMQESTLRILESELKRTMRSFSSFISPVKSSTFYKKDQNYYFEFEFTNFENLRESQGLYYQIYTPTHVFGISLVCPEKSVFKKNKNNLKKIINSFGPLYI